MSPDLRPTPEPTEVELEVLRDLERRSAEAHARRRS
jgi:hypothetical protein